MKQRYYQQDLFLRRRWEFNPHHSMERENWTHEQSDPGYRHKYTYLKKNIDKILTLAKNETWKQKLVI